ncbi:ABC transporter substrate-binding protein [Bordetella genomosp. 13]|uniref:ABC transporter substrate-binding protein n=1 Tax=Bordetella genomosp. 13 TaxID=463040 RepID=UPI00119DA592|nr:ABC transporter substrate-binding protein [Bordetella genomosp. 13]
MSRPADSTASLAFPLRTAAVILSLLGGVPAAHAAGEPTRGGIIQYGHLQEPPCLFGGWVQQWYLQRQFSDNLVSRTADGRIVPWLATSWTISDDHKVYTFEIKPGVKFTDGTPLDAQAVVDNFTGWLSKDPDRRNNASNLYFGEQFKTATAAGPLTVRIEFNQPYYPFLNVLSHSVHGILSPTALKQGLKVNCEKPVGSGPFIVEKWNHGQDVVFRRNPDYNSAPADAKHQGPAYVDGLVWKFLKEPTVRYGSLLSGESDVIYDVPAVNWQEANKRYTVQQHITGGSPLRFQLNTARAPFDDVRVRRAFAQASDRKGAVQAAFLGSVPFEGNGALAQSSPEYTRELADAYPYDSVRAGKLLDEAGWTARDAQGIRTKDGQPLVVRIAYSVSHVTPDGVQALQIIQQQARETGFDVRLLPTTQAEWYAGKNRGPNDYEIQPAYWVASTAEIFRVSWRSDEPGRVNANNASRFQDPALWKLIDEADQTFDDARRTQLYRQAERLIVDNAAVVGFTVLPVTIASDPKLKDVWLARGAVGEPVFSDAYFEK